MAKAQNTSNKVEYNKDMLSLLNDLSAINESVIINKNDKKLSVQRANNARSIAYRLSMESSVFNFSGDQVSFYKFPEFFQLLSCFDSPELHQTDDKLVISKDKCKINYLLSDPETLTKSPKQIQFDNPQVEFKLSTADIKELKKMIGLLTAKNTKFTCAKNKVDITCYNSGHDNSFSKSYPTDKCTKDLSFAISSDVFPVIPEGDYVIELMEKPLPNSKDGKTISIVRFTLQKKDTALEIFTAQLDGE